MVKSYIEVSSLISQQLLEVGKVVDLFERNEYESVERWKQWLKQSEELLEKYNYNEASLLAGLRANIVKEEKSTEVRKKRKQVVSQALATIDSGQHVLFSINKDLSDKINTVRTLIKQILIPAKESGLISSENIVDFGQYLESLLQQFKQHPQLAASINNAIGLIGKFDVLRIIAEEIDFC